MEREDKAIEKKFINLKILSCIKKPNKIAITKKKSKQKEKEKRRGEKKVLPIIELRTFDEPGHVGHTVKIFENMLLKPFLPELPPARPV